MILRVVLFAAMVAFSSATPLLAWGVMVATAIVHYILAVPYSKRLIIDALRRRRTAFYFFSLVVAAVIISTPVDPILLFVLFGFHYAFSEVYLIYENVLPNLWEKTRTLRAASLVFNLSAYFAAIRQPIFSGFQHTDALNYSVFAVSACIVAGLLVRSRELFSKAQFAQLVAFETFALATVLWSINAPISHAAFILYHVIFWFFYPSIKMIEKRQSKPLFIFLAANAVVSIVLFFFMPISHSPIRLTGAIYSEIFRFGSVFHIITTLAVTAAQPAWITRIFHPDFTRTRDSAPPVPAVVRA